MPNDAGSGTPYQSTVNGSGQSHAAGGDCETVVGVCLEVAANHAEVVGVVSYITAQTPVLMNLIADSACLTPTLAAGAPVVTGGGSANASGATNANAPFTGTSHTVLTTGFCRCAGGCFTAQRPPASTPPEVLILMTNQSAASSPNTVNLSQKFSGKDYKLVAICQRSHSPSSASASGTGARYTAILLHSQEGWLRYDNLRLRTEVRSTSLQIKPAGQPRPRLIRFLGKPRVAVMKRPVDSSTVKARKPLSCLTPNTLLLRAFVPLTRPQIAVLSNARIGSGSGTQKTTATVRKLSPDSGTKRPWGDGGGEQS